MTPLLSKYLDPRIAIANFYFGSFGNNYVDDGSIKRIRDYDSLPRFGIDEVSAQRFVREMADWDLPPYIFESVAPSIYLTWLRSAFFAGRLWSDPESATRRAEFTTVGGQSDLSDRARCCNANQSPLLTVIDDFSRDWTLPESGREAS